MENCDNVPISSRSVILQPNVSGLPNFHPQKRRDCFPNDPTSIVEVKNRHDAPYSTVGDISWSGNLKTKEKLPNPRLNDKRFVPFVGFLKNEDRAKLPYDRGFYNPGKIATDGFVQVKQR